MRRADDPEGVRLIQDTNARKSVLLKIYGYLVRATPPRESGGVADEDIDYPLDENLGQDVFSAFHGRTALIFASLRSTIEACADFARRVATRRALPDLFRVHHGSLSKGEREDTGDALRSGRPTAAFCSSTLQSTWSRNH
jgi:ATP-dependent Lhr-like helicase